MFHGSLSVAQVRNTKRFYVLNPTSIPYEITWECEDNPGVVSPFRCATRRGVVQEGKKMEIVFEYTPETTALTVCIFVLC